MEDFEKELNDPEVNSTLAEMKLIGEGLDTALEFGLEVEVIYYALNAMKADPTLTHAEAFYYGIAEWIK